MTGPASKQALRHSVAALGVPYGFERSCKIIGGNVFGDRYLLSVHRTALGADPLGQIRSLFAAVGTPEALGAELSSNWPGTDVVHFGYEAADDVEICKVYFEHVDALRRAQAKDSDRPVLVHRAWKWPLPAAQRCLVTDYTWRKAARGENLMTRISQFCEPAGDDHPSVRAIRKFREAADDAVVFNDLMLLEVEEGTERRSFDLNLYPAKLVLRQVAPALDRLCDDFGVPRAQFDAVFDPILGLRLGHISGGYGRDGRSFVTIYFGVESC
jgi:tryptophan halogenase